jgi:hypothetical protein
MPVNTGQNEACGITNAPDLGLTKRAAASIFLAPSGFAYVNSCMAPESFQFRQSGDATTQFLTEDFCKS